MDKDQLVRFPFFTGKMLSAFLGKNNPSITLTRWKHNLITLEKGKYTVHTNPLVYATVVVVPSYCSFRSALQYYGLTNQIPLAVQVVCVQRKRSVKHVAFIQVSKKVFFGYRKELVEGFDFFIAEKEKLLLDCLLYPRAGVAVNELVELLKEPLEKKKLVDYLRIIGNVSLIKRVGYLLDIFSGIDIFTEFEQEIAPNRNYPKLNALLPKSSVTDKKWKLLVNDAL